MGTVFDVTQTEPTRTDRHTDELAWDAADAGSF